MSKSGWFPTIEMMPYRFAGIRMQIDNRDMPYALALLHRMYEADNTESQKQRGAELCDSACIRCPAQPKSKGNGRYDYHKAEDIQPRIGYAVVAQIDHQHNSRKQQQNIAWISRFERTALFIAVYAANQLCNFGHLLSPLRLQVYIYQAAKNSCRGEHCSPLPVSL